MDADLVMRAQHGDKEAFTRLAGELSPPFLSVAHRILRDIGQAEDATQQALLNVWQRLPQLRDPERFEAWSYRLLVRACYDEARRASRWAAPLRMLPTGGAWIADASGLVIDRDQLERAFRRLSIEHRTVVVLRHYQHLSLEEVAAALELPIGTVASRLHYALRELRAALEADARPAEAQEVVS
jgi:RNA polymerase sigma-70 factor (ECF subfamily)